jgi:hypothetical protein
MVLTIATASGASANRRPRDAVELLDGVGKIEDLVVEDVAIDDAAAPRRRSLRAERTPSRSRKSPSTSPGAAAPM